VILLNGYQQDEIYIVSTLQKHFFKVLCREIITVLYAIRTDYTLFVGNMYTFIMLQPWVLLLNKCCQIKVLICKWVQSITQPRLSMAIIIIIINTTDDEISPT